MKRIVLLSVMVLLCAGLAGAVLASGDQKAVTLEGKIVCAKCALHEEVEQCQNVLVVEKEGKKSMYYLTKNDVYAKMGDVCMASPTVRVTGAVSTQEGKTWIVASEIKPVEGKG